MADDQQQALREQAELRKEAQRDQILTQTGSQMAAERVSERQENPEFADKVSDPDADSAVYSWVEDEMGPAFSRMHVFANRGFDHEHRREWLNQNRAERMVSRGTPGRLLARDPVALSIAQQVHNRSDISRQQRFVQREREAIRDAHNIKTDMESLGVDNTGLSSLTEATVVSKQEKREETSEQSVKERAASAIYGE